MGKPSMAERVRARAQAETKSSPTPDHFVLKCLDNGERGDGLLFQKIHDDKIIHDHASGLWWKFEGHTWQEDTREYVLGAGIDAVADKYAEESMRQAWAAATASKAGRDAEAKAAEALQKRLLDRVRKIQDMKRRRNILAAAKADHGLVGDEWDKLPGEMACSNGIIDLRTGTLRTGRPEDYIRTAAPTEYDPDAAAPTWESFLDDVFDGDAEFIAYVQRLLGYALTGQVTEHVIPIFWGAGRNGKGTMLETIRHVIAAYSHKAESELLLAQRQARSPGAPNSAILALRGKRLVYCAETGTGRKIDAARVKELAGGDTLNARGVYDRRHVEFTPTHQIILMTNAKPKAPAGDYALWQRIQLVPFKMAFVDRPSRPHERPKDSNLFQKLQAEAPGILKWLVRGAMDYIQRGRLDPPASVLTATEEYRQEEDLIGQFLNDCCVFGPTCQVKAGELRNAFEKYCQENGYKCMAPKQFGMELKDRLDWYEHKSCRFYTGLGLLARE